MSKLSLAAACALALAPMVLPAPAHAVQPIVTDSRIKTFVYNANEVFAITTEYGYQSNIEFGERESIDTVSVGDRVSWQIIPAGRRLFIRAMEENAHTNMTVVTNKHAYQFDLRSSSAATTIGSEELTYVVRFFYPETGEGVLPASYSNELSPPMPLTASPVSYAPAPAPMMMSTPAPMPVATGALPPPSMAYSPESMNYRYTYSGPNAVAPVKIYDDGKTTYFKFRGNSHPQFSVVTATGEQMTVPARSAGQDMYAVDVIAPRFSIRQGEQQVIVYNESNGA